MEQRDYFMRQVEQLGQVLGILLAQLLGIKKQGDVGQGITLINDTLVEQVDLNLEELLTIKNESLVSVLMNQRGFSLAQVDFTAELLYQSGEFYQMNPEQKELGLAYWEKALVLFEYVTATDLVFSFDRQKKIDRIKRL